MNAITISKNDETTPCDEASQPSGATPAAESLRDLRKARGKASCGVRRAATDKGSEFVVSASRQAEDAGRKLTTRTTVAGLAYRL